MNPVEAGEKQNFELGEIILYSLLALFVDGICLLLDLTVVGLVIAPIIQGLASFGFSMILRSRGDGEALSFKKQIGPQMWNLAPALPTVFGTSLRRMIVHNKPAAAVLAGGIKSK